MASVVCHQVANQAHGELRVHTLKHIGVQSEHLRGLLAFAWLRSRKRVRSRRSITNDLPTVAIRESPVAIRESSLWILTGLRNKAATEFSVPSGQASTQ